MANQVNHRHLMRQHDQLTARQREIVGAVLKCGSIAVAARELGLSRNAIHYHVEAACDRMRVRSVHDLRSLVEAE
jgi:DNA-binding NarL/FixJ family response regulator